MKPEIFVTRPFLPPLDELLPLLKEIWDSRVLTNGGPFHKKLELALCESLGVNYISLFGNGTLALIAAMQQLGVGGEVITTPYSFVATTNSLVWNRLTPVFVDIDRETLNLDPRKIEAAITERTCAILAVHCYGRPCDVESIQEIADRHRLKVVYDAAHAFGVNGRHGSLLLDGDLSVLSFHATKVFNTFEGGAVVCRDEATKKHLDMLKNFGLTEELEVEEPGMNGKMSEFNAALGLVQLTHMKEILEKRRAIHEVYLRRLAGVRGVLCSMHDAGEGQNFSYFPILIDSNYSLTRDGLFERLRDAGVYSRKYFYPLISQFPLYRELASAKDENLPVACSIAQQVLCLPIYPELELSEAERIADLIVTA